MFRGCLVAVLLLVAVHAAAAAPQADAAADDLAYRRVAALITLIDDSSALPLPVRVERALLLTLNAASQAVHNGEHARALTLLRTFIFEVRGVRRAKRLPRDAADALTVKAEEAIAALTMAR